jgi:hypothetical protein
VASLGVLLIYGDLWVHLAASQQRQADFSVFYAAALLLRHGQGAHLYSQALEVTSHASILLPGAHIALSNLPFITPPTTALIVLPLTWLGPSAGYWTFASLQAVLFVIAAVITLRARPQRVGMHPAAWLLAALAGGGTFLAVIFGQADGIPCLGLAVAYFLWRRDRRLGAGLWLGISFGLTKPHLLLGVIAFLIGRRDWRSLLGLGVGVVGVAAVSVGLVGPAGSWAFFSGLLSLAGRSTVIGNVGVFGAVERLVGQNGWSLPLAGFVAAVGLMLSWWLGARVRQGTSFEIGLVGAVALSLAVAPHLLPYDLCLLGPALLWSVDEWRWGSSWSLVGWVLFSLATVAEIFSWTGAGRPVGVDLIPAALLGAGCLAAFGSRRSPVTEGAPRHRGHEALRTP